MATRIALLTILTDDVPRLAAFYRDVLGFAEASDSGGYIEFAHEGIRLAICGRDVMATATGHASYQQPRQGQTFELALPAASRAEADERYAAIRAAGGADVRAPRLMPWGQYTGFFADPDGNILEIFTDGE